MRVILSLLFEKLFVKILTLRQTYYMLRMFAVRFFVKCGYFNEAAVWLFREQRRSAAYTA